MSIQTAEISDDFIGVFDGYFGDEIINRYLLWWKELEGMGMTQPRENLSHEKNDMSYDSFSGAFFEHNFNINYFNLTDTKSQLVKPTFLLPRRFAK